MVKTDRDAESSDGQSRPEIGTVPLFLKRIRRYFKKSEFDLDSPVIWDKSRYSAALFGFLFYDVVNKRRVNSASLENLDFLVRRSLNTIEQERTGIYVACLVRDWRKRGWVECGGYGEMLTLTRDGTEQITKVNAGKRGGIIFAYGKGVSERGQVEIVSILCKTVLLLALIIAVTWFLRDVVAIAGDVIETFTDPTKIIRKIPFVGELF